MICSKYLNNTSNRREIQDDVWNVCKPLPREDFERNADSIIASMAPAARNVLNCLLSFGCHQNIFVSQTTIGKRSGIARETVYRVLPVLVELGLIAKRYRHMQTCQYKIADIFSNPFMRSRLKRLLKGIKFLPMALLFTPAFSQDIEVNVSQRLDKNYIYREKREICKKAVTYLEHDETFSQAMLRMIEEDYRKYGAQKTTTRSVFASVNDKFLYDKREESRSMHSVEIDQEIKAITSFKPTVAGQVELSLFSPVVIKQADEAMKKRSDLIDPFRYFIGICRALTKEQHLPLRFEHKKKLIEKFNVTDEQPRFDPDYVPVKAEQTATAGKAISAPKVWTPEIKKAQPPKEFNKVVSQPISPKALQVLGPEFAQKTMEINLARWHDQQGHVDCGCPDEIKVDNAGKKEYKEEKSNEVCWPDGSPISADSGGNESIWEEI